MKNYAVVLFLALMTSSCAMRYNKIEPNSVYYPKKIQSESVEVAYQQNITDVSQSNRMSKKFRRKGVQMVTVEIKNNTARNIHFMDEFHFKIDGRSVRPMNPENATKLLKQTSGLYFLGLIGFQVSFTSSDQGSGGSAWIGINPLGLIYAIPNMLIAKKSNKTMRNELSDYNPYSLKIAPGEKAQAILVLPKRGHFEIFSDHLNEAVEVVIKHEILNLDKLQYDKTMHASFDEYYAQIKRALEISTDFNDPYIDNPKYGNGNYRHTGIKSANNLTLSNTFYYKVGTWRYFHKNGQLKTYIEYNHLGQEDGLYIEYDENGNEILREHYEDGKKKNSGQN